MEIEGRITGIKYKIFLEEELQVFDMNTFNINNIPPYCVLIDNKHFFAISKWVSPKRTRSYPYERVYNTLNISKKITVIPIVKDEGAVGDRDYLQWDTVALMSLLDVFVVFAYYEKAEINPKFQNKITNQQFDNKYIISKIKEIEQYHSSALHWNLNELKNNLHSIIDKARQSYVKIERKTGIKLHNLSGLDNFKAKIGKDVSKFMEFSREKARDAQTREIFTTQPKESLFSATKAKITITNFLGGQYFFTVDEIEMNEDTVYLIEDKHSVNSFLPSKSDIKDGLLKMILYSNLSDVTVNETQLNSKAVLSLTSVKLTGAISSKSATNDIAKFLLNNNISHEHSSLINKLFSEAEENNFIVKIGYAQ